jgi:carboxylesterase type B
MVYIHAGSWFFGSGNGKTDLAGPGYFLDRNVVYVTMKYRLGAFGWTRLTNLHSVLKTFEDPYFNQVFSAPKIVKLPETMDSWIRRWL